MTNSWRTLYYKYDKDGNRIYKTGEQLHSESNPQTGLVTCNSSDNDILTFHYSHTGQITLADYRKDSLSVHYTYNDEGRLIEKEYTKNDFPVQGKNTYNKTLIEYNDGNDIEKKFIQTVISSTQSADTVTRIEMYAYKYDPNNNWLKRVYMGNGKVEETRRSIYYHDGSYSSLDTLAVADKDRIFTKDEADFMAQYGEGEDKMHLSLTNTLRFPYAAQKAGINGVVTVGFQVSKEGKISDIKLAKKLYNILDNEVMKAVKLLAKKAWIPGKKNGKDVDTYNELSVDFRIIKEGHVALTVEFNDNKF
ncbi:energy transducer TonB [Dysgonomonas sp. 511]|uniref:energy transducer TonB n=1 Tax=Dysgonomonas sp. 511 TaxID=2302930 RepID=UPI0013D0F700|nr:energy transducer TonB [Dysgonomonas sp. 511]